MSIPIKDPLIHSPWHRLPLRLGIVLLSLVVGMSWGMSRNVLAQDTDSVSPAPVQPSAFQSGSGTKKPASAPSPSPTKEEATPVIPWDYDPYQVLVWVAFDDPRMTVDQIETDLRKFLDRDFDAIWRLSIEDAPSSVAAVMSRSMDDLDYDTITSADPVLAIKKDHIDSVRIRTAENVGAFVSKIFGFQGDIAGLTRRAQESGNESLDGIVDRLTTPEDPSQSMSEIWADETSEALLTRRGFAKTLVDPVAKIIKPRIDGLITDALEQFDKVFLVNVCRVEEASQIEAVELDVLMRFVGPVTRMPLNREASVSHWIGQSMVNAFAPMVRIDNAGQKTVQGLVRAGGLILNEDSPAMIRKGESLKPLVRKNDRNGDPFLIGPIDWAHLIVDEVDGNKLKMDFYNGRSGGLQGRKNKRTFRMAIRLHPNRDFTTLRLHAQGKPDFPLIGYEIYQRVLKAKTMNFVGRTDWDGRLEVKRTKGKPLRLLYVKNGGAVLARLPLVPGLQPLEVADIRGDDLRLQAEAYIRGVQNAIIDLVAVRELFKARIGLRLQRGEMTKAKDLMDALRGQPSNEALANDMGKRQTVYLERLGNRNAGQRRKIDQMFTTTRDLLSKHINPKLLRDLESDIIRAEKNGGKLPPPKENPDEVDSHASAGDVPANSPSLAVNSLWLLIGHPLFPPTGLLFPCLRVPSHDVKRRVAT